LINLQQKIINVMKLQNTAQNSLTRRIYALQ